MLVKCERCGGEFESPSGKRRRFCSHKCANTRHGQSRDRLYVTWSGMKSRCYLESNAGYKYYGGRGIEVCDDWRNSFVVFRDWAIESGYKDCLELDREDPNGNYEPSNCRWATRSQQMLNTRNRPNKRSRFRGVSWHTQNNKWRAIIACGKTRHLGCFTSELKAAFAYDEAAHQIAGEFARLNFPERILNRRKEGALS